MERIKMEKSHSVMHFVEFSLGVKKSAYAVIKNGTIEKKPDSRQTASNVTKQKFETKKLLGTKII